MIGNVGDEHTVMTVGLGVVGSLYSFGNDLRLKDATPLAQLMSEPEGVIVPGNSPFKTIDDFVKIVQTPERLRLLLVLTVADIRAVGPGVFNGWKGQLLRDLYAAAEEQMLGGRIEVSQNARVRSARDGLAGRVSDWTQADRDHALRRLS